MPTVPFWYCDPFWYFAIDRDRPDHEGMGGRPTRTHRLRAPRQIERPVPVPGPGQVRVHVRVCGVCRTDLHLAEGDLTPKHAQVVPGHEVVGLVDELGPGCVRFSLGDRVGIPWLASVCGRCRFCLDSRENLCVAPRFTGWDVDGGYAEYAVIDEGFAYDIPEVFSDEEAAPLLCPRGSSATGPFGGRSFRRVAGSGIYGFGGAAHLTAQVAMAEGARVHVMTRAPEARALALELGAASGETPTTRPPNRSMPPSCSHRWERW